MQHDSVQKLRKDRPVLFKRPTDWLRFVRPFFKGSVRYIRRELDWMMHKPTRKNNVTKLTVISFTLAIDNHICILSYIVILSVVILSV